MKKKPKQKQKKSGNKVLVFGVVSVVAFVAALGLLSMGLSSTIGEIKQVAVTDSPEVILASAGVSDEKDIYLSVAYYDQRADECVNAYDAALGSELVQRQFEWESCGYLNKDLEQGLVDYELGEDHLPVFHAGKKTTNKALDATERWFKAVEGKSASYIGALKMDYEVSGAEFSFYQDRFYPVDEAKFSEGDVVNKDGHNHLFTMSFAVPFTVLANGGEQFEIAADDDTFVFVGDRLAIDLGGVHGVMGGRFEIHDDGEVYTAIGDEEPAYSGIRLNGGDGSMVRIFHADRDASQSVFNVKFAGMNISVVNTQLADNGHGDSMQIAYDPTNPSYEAPLGQSVVIQPDNTKGYMIMATIEGMMVVVFAVLIVIAAKMVLKKRVEKQ